MTTPTPSPVIASEWPDSLSPAFVAALTKKGYTSLTPVQKSVLDPALAGRDLRISSQTGSGKTLAVGLVLESALLERRSEPSPVARPRALVIAPTRELAKQVEGELGWLYAPQKLGVVAVTGGSSYRDERRALVRGPSIVVGTPGRLLDHLERGSIDASDVGTVVLDEADRMLELGFREELEAILAKLPAEHRTHLVSATFAREVKALADRVQKNARSVEGTPLGSANVDIEHVVYLAPAAQRVDALVNLLLFHPEARTLVFARTRAEVADITRELKEAGFAADSLSGELEQDARTRALAAFRRGDTRTLVATDVAGRGIDVRDVTLVIQLDPPPDPDTYTHRSGRTGRAGRKGTSALLVTPNGYKRTLQILAHAKVRFRTEPIPTAEILRAAEAERRFAALTRDSDQEPRPEAVAEARRLLESGLAERALARLLSDLPGAAAEPRDVVPLSHQPERQPYRAQRPSDVRQPTRVSRDERREPTIVRREPAGVRREPADEKRAGGWVPFSVSWGEQHGADARRLVAMLCRRGSIRGTDIGAIRVHPTSSSVEIAAHVAGDFRSATRAPDPRDPRVSIVPLEQAQPHAARPWQRPAFGKRAAAKLPPAAE